MNSLVTCGRYNLDLSHPKIMAILNVTTDSFSGDGNTDLDAVLRKAELAIQEGADLLDIGGESSRPGSQPVSEQLEMDRVIPVVEALVKCGVPLSVDTVKPAVMRESIRAGADLINDIAAFQAPDAIEAVAESNVGLCVMHMQGDPATMQLAPCYGDVVAEVAAFLETRVAVLQSNGVVANRIVVDPGFGFGKTITQNVALLSSMHSIVKLGYPVLVGMSRKSMLGAITGRPVDQRVVAGAAAALIAVQAGARIVRTHDVGATRDVLHLWDMVESSDA